MENLERPVTKLGIGLLDALLRDRSTGRNILWATDQYESQGPEYRAGEEITSDLISHARVELIQPRVKKAAGQQTARTKKRAEVFTPAWLCGWMNDQLDADWFGREGMFGAAEENRWEPTPGPVCWPKNRSWKRYVNTTCLEITCGEAPFLVSRYDAATGQAIPVTHRGGILDRKLRAVSEQTETEEEWWQWAWKALHAVYGYEYQGDSLLVARINVLWTLSDHLEGRWGRAMTEKELEKAADIISWNLFQADGLTGRPPMDQGEQDGQLLLFDPRQIDWEKPVPHGRDTPVVIKQWKKKKRVPFYQPGEEKKMKFDYVIGNPPYQEETGNKSLVNGQQRRKSIFQFFQMGADQIAEEATVLIYPAGRWIQRSGKGMRNFGIEQINDPRLSSLFVYRNAKEVFKDADIGDGVSIVVKNMKKRTDTFSYTYIQGDNWKNTVLKSPGEKIIPLDPADMIIVEKIEAFIEREGLTVLHERVLSQKLFGIESDFVEKNGSKVRRLEEGVAIDRSREIKLYANDKAGKAGRTCWFVADRDVICTNAKYIDKWKVVVSSANAGGQKRDNQLEILDDYSAFGRSRVALGVFDTKREAENFYKYVDSYVVRYALLMTDEALTTLALKVPDMGDYTDSCQHLDFTQDIDAQLFEKLALTEEEVAYLKNRVDIQKRKGE